MTLATTETCETSSIIEARAPNQALRERLDWAHARGQYRTLPIVSRLADFSSNDYLGLATQPHREYMGASIPDNTFVESTGSTGSRLLSGNGKMIETLEELARERHRAEAALVFNSGYDANLGLISSLPRDGAQIFYDEQAHASTKDGVAISRALSQPFRHNDLNHLEKRLKTATKEVYVCVDALYSMDGQFAPLVEMAELCERYGAHLIVDEAHSGGVYGDQGAGLVQELGLEKKVFARVITYGKAFGCHGACVLGPALLKEYLVNFAHSFIYTTALSPSAAQNVINAYGRISRSSGRERLERNIELFCTEISRSLPPSSFVPSTSAIQGLFLPGNRVVAGSRLLAAEGFDVKAIRSPTVKRGTERLRIGLHSFNTPESITNLVEILARLV